MRLGTMVPSELELASAMEDPRLLALATAVPLRSDEWRRYDRIAQAVMATDQDDVAAMERAAEGAKLLGVGGHRAVFALDERRVLKVAIDWGMLEPDEIGQNAREADRWREAPGSARALMAPVLARSDDDAWLLMARTLPVTSLTATQARRLRQVTRDVVPANAGTIDGRLVAHDYGHDPEKPREPSLFIGLRPSVSDRRRLARSATEPSDDLHVTMTFHGKLAKLPSDAYARAVRAVRSVAERHGPVSARVLRSARFDGPEQDVIYAALRETGVVALHDALSVALSAEGLPADATFDYVPHITLGKVPHGAPWPMPEPPAVELAFGSVYLWVGRVFRSFPLRGQP